MSKHRAPSKDTYWGLQPDDDDDDHLFDLPLPALSFPLPVPLTLGWKHTMCSGTPQILHHLFWFTAHTSALKHLQLRPPNALSLCFAS